MFPFQLVVATLRPADKQPDDVWSQAVLSPDVLRTALALLADLLRLLLLMFGRARKVAAENLFLRKQLACSRTPGSAAMD